MEKDQYLLSSVNNTLALVDVLSHYPALSLAELCKLSPCDKASIFRMLHTLEANGFVEKTADAKYKLGLKFLYYGHLVEARQDIIAAARAPMQQLCAECGLAVHLGRLSRARVVTVHIENPRYDIQVTARVGMNAPAYSTAMGRVLLAYLPQAERDAVLEGVQFKRYSPNSVTARPQLEKLLGEVRRTGVARDVNDRFPGFGGLAVPLFDHSGRCAAALSIVSLASVVLEQEGEYVQGLKQTAETISRALGCGQYPA